MTMMLTQLLFFSFSNIYENQMQTYILLKNHYQSQTLLGMTERNVYENKEISAITFNIGEVWIEKSAENTYILTSQLRNGYSETRIIIMKQIGEAETDTS